MDAIVNAANAILLPGGGVDGAIRRAAGPELTEATQTIGRCPTGQAVITRGYRPAGQICDPYRCAGVGRRISRRRSGSAAGLVLCEHTEAGRREAIESIAFPAIGTGIYGWPPDVAAEIAFNTVLEHLRDGGKQTRVIFCCFSEEDGRGMRPSSPRIHDA